MNEVTIVLISLVSIVCLVVLLFWLYKELANDAFREKMFALRGELFDEACKGVVSFDDEAYAILRTTLNGFIQFSHKTSFMQLILLSVCYQKPAKNMSYMDNFKQIVGGYSKEKRDIYLHFSVRMNFYILMRVALWPFIFIASLIVPVAVLVKIMKLIEQRAVALFGSSLNTIDTVAFKSGKHSPL